MSNLHAKQVVSDGIHGIISYEYADSSERIAATGFESYDEHKLAIDIDTGLIFRLQDPSGPTWAPLSSGSGVSDHGFLTGLADDDHTQYLLISGARNMSGSLNMGTFNITNVGTVDGVDISDHSARHQAGSADEIDGYQIAIVYNPINYTDPVNNIIGEHIHRIDEALGSITVDHGVLTGLSDDDHIQYLLVNGTRAMSGNLNLGANNITNVGTINSVDITDHSTRHENGGPDEMSVTGLSGLLADQQTPLAHAASHIFAGSDLIDGYRVVVNYSPAGYMDPLNNLLGQHLFGIDESLMQIFTNMVTDHGGLTGLADDDHTQYLLANGTRSMSGNLNLGTNNITNVGAINSIDIADHSGRHENGGPDEISVQGLSGVLADPQTPIAHASFHVAGGQDEIDGYNLEVNYNPTYYVDPTNNLLGQHLFRIDEYLNSLLSLHGGTLLGSLNLNSNDITNIDVATNDAEHDMGNQAGASLTLNSNNGNFQKLTLTGNITSITMTAPLVGIGRFQFKFIQDGSGGRTVTGWPGTVLWPAGTDPTFSTGIGDVDILSFYWDGTSWYGVFSGDFS